jgi:hypothetical protein
MIPIDWISNNIVFNRYTTIMCRKKVGTASKKETKAILKCRCDMVYLSVPVIFELSFIVSEGI